MLVLTRELRKSVTLLDLRTGEVVAVVSVQQNRNGKIRLGFEAPKHINIVRTELLERASNTEVAAS